ncbi:MAG: ABC transporter ATP-binding protein [Deltaproteobacteria bacterium]|nr:ABC transporter ATP-binding protein [Deltaproteobacteria bacterium]
MNAVEIKNLSKNYGSLTALAGIDLNIAEGAFFALLGPNGAGKSTLINILAGLTRATSGRAAILGHDVRKEWRQARYKLGVVPQELAYDPFFTVREMLLLQSGYFGFGSGNRAWLNELLEALGLEDKADTTMNHLSGGMKRRVLIAQALVHRPPVVILDEPTAGVDVALRAQLWRFIRDLNHKGHTIILTTHYLEEAESMCEKIAILDHGKLVANTEKETLLSRYRWRQLRLHLTPESGLELPATLALKQESAPAGELLLRLHREEDHIGEVLAALEQAGIRYSDLRIHEPGLTEVYSELTGGSKNDD